MWIATKLKLKRKILDFHFFLFFFFSWVCIKMSKTLSAKYDQENEEKLQNKGFKRYQNFSIEEKKKNDTMVVNVTKISQKMKNKSLLKLEKS